MLELQQARRFEKNFFLYGTNLDDALDHVNTALKFLQMNAMQLEEVVGQQNLANILHQVRNYEIELQKLQNSTHSGFKTDQEERNTFRSRSSKVWG